MKYLVEGGELILAPNPDWAFANWDGQFSARSFDSISESNELHIVRVSDIQNHTDIAIGKSYQSIGFDVPGVLGAINLVVNIVTASQIVEDNSQRIVGESTIGTFTVEVTMSATNAQSGNSDPITTKAGSWRVADPGQQLFEGD